MMGLELISNMINRAIRFFISVYIFFFIVMMALEQDSYNNDEDGLLRWQGSSQVKNEEVVVDSEGSLRWRRRKWC